ncbi:transcriptional regulator Kaiso-like isoform X2 [Perca fluviatilis]|uniref:transcriptional regulator Kaiso-like isoform X2 n=1 Tax=Perca fluviatilis TaxID=8168 RepID=UPI001964A24B|nr:transcriptional regulator Kaiso-like isoform X2 [Perca fluviatilis]
MEVAPCVQKANSRAASLLASLNLQRGRAQFCDCVVRQRQNLSQLHPAHRCVLAASSPVLASILSSSGALVELQAPCLSDSVLVLLLDYIYTGALPYTHSQRQYYNLLAAACHLQMSELQEALKAWHQTADDTNASAGAKNQPHKDINNTYSKTVNTFSKHLPLSLEREDHQYSATVDTHDDLDPCRTSIKTGANHCSRKDASTISNASTCSVNTGDYRQVTHLTPEDLIQNIPCTAEGHVESGVDKGEVQNDPFHSAYSDCIEEELEKTHKDRRSLTLPCSAEVQEEEMSRAEKKQRLCLTVKSKAEEKETNRKEEDKTQTHLSPLLCLSASHLRENVPPSQCSSSSSSSSPHPCCGAVPVIRHSSRAAMLHLAEVSPMPPHHPVSQTSCSSNRAPDSPSGSTDSDSIVEDCSRRGTNSDRHKDP